MNNLIRYNRIFEKCFNVSKFDNIDIKYQSIPEWDSVGHMMMIASIEEEFQFFFDPEDITGFTSYEIGKTILKKYNISIE